jgi:hypothetical protein
MVDVAGGLIAFPLPNKPGMWDYRKLANDEVLEVQLTKEEWLIQDAAL